MKKEEFDEKFDQAIGEVVKELHENIEIPSSEPSWQKVNKILDKRRKAQLWKRRIQFISAAILLLFLGGVLFSNTQLTSAFNPLFTMVKKMQGEVSTFIFGVEEDDNQEGAKTPPPPDGIGPAQESTGFISGGVLTKTEVTLGEAQKRTKFHLFIPEVIPEGYALEKVELVHNDIDDVRIVNFMYTDEDQILLLVQRSLREGEQLTTSVQNPLAIVKEIKILEENDAVLTIFTDGRTHLKTLIGNLFIDISGPITEEEMVGLAESLR